LCTPFFVREGSEAIRSAIEGVVKKDIPRPSANLESVYTQKVPVEFSFGMHLMGSLQALDCGIEFSWDWLQRPELWICSIDFGDRLSRTSLSGALQTPAPWPA